MRSAPVVVVTAALSVIMATVRVKTATVRESFSANKKKRSQTK